MNIYVMKAAMKGRPYLVNENVLAPGYWQRFYAKRSGMPIEFPPKVRIEKQSARLGDVLGWIGGVPVFSAEAVALLSEVTNGTLEFLSFGDIKGIPYWVISKIPTVNDLETSSIESAPPVFCLPGNELREVLAKEVVPESVVNKKLRGFQFRRSSEPHLKSLFEAKDVNAFPGVLP